MYARTQASDDQMRVSDYLKANKLILPGQERFSPEMMVVYESATWRYGIRHKVFERDGYKCVDCGCGPTKGNWLECDHERYLPKGSTVEELLNQPLEDFSTRCRSCHKKKTAKSRRRTTRKGYKR